jgi:hypothetical protein
VLPHCGDARPAVDQRWAVSFGSLPTALEFAAEHSGAQRLFTFSALRLAETWSADGLLAAARAALVWRGDARDGAHADAEWLATASVCRGASSRKPEELSTHIDLAN